MSFKSFLKNRITLSVMGGIVLVAVLVSAAYLLLGAITKHNQEITVPDLTGMSVEDAGKLLASRKMDLNIVDSVYVKRMGRGLVYRQNPKAGSKVKEGRCIHLTINAKNSKKVRMPNLVGYSLRQAKAELLSKGLVLGRLVYRPDLATDNVLKQMLGGTEVLPGTEVESESAVDLILGLNPSDNTTYIPYLLGMKYLNAVDAVHDNSLNVDEVLFDNTVKDYTDSLNAVVYLQEPESVEDSAFVKGTGLSLYLTTDVTKVPERVEETDSTFTELTVR